MSLKPYSPSIMNAIRVVSDCIANVAIGIMTYAAPQANISRCSKKG